MIYRAVNIFSIKIQGLKLQCADHVEKWTINLIAAVNEKKKMSRLGISKISNTLIDNAEDVDIVMPMYNLVECGQNYSITPVYGILLEKKLMMSMVILLDTKQKQQEIHQKDLEMKEMQINYQYQL